MTTKKFNIGEVLEVVEGTEDMNFTWYPVGTLVTVIGRSEYAREDSDSESSYIVSKGEGTQQYLRPSQLKRIEKKKVKGFRYCITSDGKGGAEVQEKESGEYVASFVSVEDAMAFIRYKEENES